MRNGLFDCGFGGGREARHVTLVVLGTEITAPGRWFHVGLQPFAYEIGVTPAEKMACREQPSLFRRPGYREVTVTICDDESLTRN